MKCFIYIIISIGVVSCTHGCTFSAAKYDKSVFGTVRSYCEYKAKVNNNTMSAGAVIKVLPGSTFETLDCMSCSCSEIGMSCCGQEPINAPPECEVIMDGCEPMVVLKSNNQTECYSGEPVSVVRDNRRFIRQLLFYRQSGYGTQNGNGNGAGPDAEETMQPWLRGLMLSNFVKQMGRESRSTGSGINNLLFLSMLGGDMA